MSALAEGPNFCLPPGQAGPTGPTGPTGPAAAVNTTITLSEVVQPSAPASGCILYVDSTTHALMAIFSTGSPVLIAAHP